MIRTVSVFVALVGMIGIQSAFAAEPLETMPAELSRQYAQQLHDLFQKTYPDVPAKFDVDPGMATGYFAGKDGILCVPKKGLVEGNLDPAADSENGAGLCMLFFSPCYVPLKDGKPVDEKSLRHVKIEDADGNERDVLCLIVTAKHVEADQWQLYAFGTDSTPIVKSKFSDSSRPAEKVVTMRVNSSRDTSASLELIVYRKYASSFEIAAK